jgi:hypothetical protein
MLMMSVVLAEDFHVQYDPVLQTNLAIASTEDRFFAFANPVFLTGLLGEERKGTCSSMPVLYVALGRRLGYPLYLVTTKGIFSSAGMAKVVASTLKRPLVIE